MCSHTSEVQWGHMFVMDEDVVAVCVPGGQINFQLKIRLCKPHLMQGMKRQQTPTPLSSDLMICSAGGSKVRQARLPCTKALNMVVFVTGPSSSTTLKKKWIGNLHGINFYAAWPTFLCYYDARR